MTFRAVWPRDVTQLDRMFKKKRRISRADGKAICDDNAVKTGANELIFKRFVRTHKSNCYSNSCLRQVTQSEEPEIILPRTKTSKRRRRRAQSVEERGKLVAHNNDFLRAAIAKEKKI